MSDEKNNAYDPNLSNLISTFHEVFTPSTPITDKSQCYGRDKTIKQITSSFKEPGKHVILYGGRGYGKTSVANVVKSNLTHTNNFFIVKINCHRTLNSFTEVWRDIFKTIAFTLENNTFIKKKKKLDHYFSNLDKIITKKEISVIDVIEVFKKIDFPFLIILDEADLIPKDEKSKGYFADIIKAFSDQLPLIKLLIIGIAESSQELIGEHTSLERCLVEVKIEWMEEQELADLLDGSLFKVKMQAKDEVRKNIILFAHGLPYYIHLITLYALEDAVSLNYKTIVEKNFQTAVIRAIENMDKNLNHILKKVLGRSPERYRQILNAAVTLEENSLTEQYYLALQDVHHQINYEEVGFTLETLSGYLLKKHQFGDEKKVVRILNLFSSPSKGVISKQEGRNKKSGKRYYFTNPLFRAFLHYKRYQATEVPKPVFIVS